MGKSSTMYINIYEYIYIYIYIDDFHDFSIKPHL